MWMPGLCVAFCGRGPGAQKLSSESLSALAPWLLVARSAQSVTHLVSVSVLAVNVRFAFFALQLAIAIYWTWALLAG